MPACDGGSIWTSLGSLSGVGNGLGNEVMDIKVHPEDNSVLFVATRSGLYKVTDTGAVPAPVVPLGGGFLPFDIDIDSNPNNDNYPRAVAVDSSNPLIIYVSNGKSGVYKSTDGGSTFVAKNTGITQLTSPSAITSAMAMSPANSQKLLSYQITAANSPTSFNAAGLPAALAVSTATGLIAGTPATAGTSSVTISAANSSGTGSAGLSLSVYSACDLNRDWATNVVDVQLQVNQALGVTACTSDLNRDGVCNVIDVQRVVNVGLGGQCLRGP